MYGLINVPFVSDSSQRQPDANLVSYEIAFFAVNTRSRNNASGIELSGNRYTRNRVYTEYTSNVKALIE
jgi:hypothetical protein